MAMNPAALKAKMKIRLFNSLKAQLGGDVGKGKAYTPVAEAQLMKMAEAISDVALDIVLEIQQNATVTPGIPTVGGEKSQVTVAPGKIL